MKTEQQIKEKLTKVRIELEKGQLSEKGTALLIGQIEALKYVLRSD
jgi:hypothetical protein